MLPRSFVKSENLAEISGIWSICPSFSKRNKMKIALFSAVPEEVGAWGSRFHFTGIGRENATRSLLDFVTRHQGEEYTIVNVGTVGSHAFPVGTILSIDEIVSAGSVFNDFRMQP